MRLIPDDPIIRCIERTGWPPWITEDPPYWEDIEEDDDEEDDETEEVDELPGTAPRL